MGEMIGMNVEQIRTLARQLRDSGADLNRVKETLSQSLATSTWAGPNAEEFRQLWHGHLSPQLTDTTQVLSGMHEVLLANAQDQEEASNSYGDGSQAGISMTTPHPGFAGGGGGGGGGGGWGPEDPSLFDRIGGALKNLDDAMEIPDLLLGLPELINDAHDIHWFAKNVEGLSPLKLETALPWKDGGKLIPWLADSKLGTALNVGGKALGVLGVGASTYDMVDGIRSGDWGKAGEGFALASLGTVALLAAPPVGTAAAAVGLLCAGGKLVYENWDGITEFTAGAAEAIGSGAEAVGSAIADSAQAVGQAAGEAVERAGDALTSVANGAKEFASEAGKTAVETAKKLWPF